MAMKTGGGDELNSEINVTPFVDVMLVLLIIFMITAPMMNNTGVDLNAEIKVPPFADVMLVLLIFLMIPARIINTPGAPPHLPPAPAPNTAPPKGKLFLPIKKPAEISLGGTPVTWQTLEAKLKAN